jgi:tetratricopeptide (TPR) repeat protein
MIIIHKLNDFLFNLFPKTRERGSSLDALREELTDFYTFGPYRPKVEIEGDFVKIEIDTSAISSQKAEFDTAVKYCEKGKFRKAKPILEKLIKKNPTVSEYHRILGQVYSDEGDQDKAINCLIDALRWDPRNSHALIMVGNIFARHHNDIETAMTYYEQALTVKPDDHIAMNNIGANLMQLGRFKEAERYFESAFRINDGYPNTLYALAMIHDVKGDYHKAFDWAIQSLKKSKTNDPIYNNAVNLATEISHKIIKNPSIHPSIHPSNSYASLADYSEKLKTESGKEVDIIEDQTIPTAAKLEIAENYNRDRHVIKYKKDNLAIAHLIMHELVHLDYTVQARRKGTNFLFVSTKDHKETFIRDNEPIIIRLNQEGVPDRSIADFITSLFNGMNSQIGNAPVDLFIEDFLFNAYPDVRPIQFISLLSLQKEYIESAGNNQIIKYSPVIVRSANLILNLVHCLQLKDLFGYDLIPSYKTTSQDMKITKRFYQEYLQYQKNNQSLEAYKLIMHWAEELKIDRYFTMVEENEYWSRKVDTDQIISTVEEERLHVENIEADSALKQPLNNEGQPAGQMAVVMYCLSALQYFEDKDLSEIQKVGFEIAMLGRQGIDPSNNEKKYHLDSIPGKEFTGLQLLAYMYAAFQVIDPFLDTGMNFKKEYETAKEKFLEMD